MDAMADNHIYTVTLLKVLQQRSPNSTHIAALAAQGHTVKLAQLAWEKRRIEKRDNLWKLAHLAVKVAFYRSLRAPAVQGLCAIL